MKGVQLHVQTSKQFLNLTPTSKIAYKSFKKLKKKEKKIPYGTQNDKTTQNLGKN